MATIERDIVLQGKTASGQNTIDLPVTALKNVEDTAEVKTTPESGDYVPLIDTTDSGQMKKTTVEKLLGSAKNVMKGATASAAGAMGLTPAPAAGAQNKYLRGDGTWQTPPDTNTTYAAATQSAAGLMSAADKKKLDGVAASANAYSLPAATSSVRGGVKTGYTANGKNYPVQLSDEQMFVSVPWTDTNTTYSAMAAATADAAGKAGLVPAPAAGAQNKYLRGDGTWQTPPDTNTTYTAASAAPKAAGTAAVGTSAKYAREDHVHPAQTDISGNAGTATNSYKLGGSTLEQVLAAAMLAAHPVGSYYWSSDATNPASLFGGMWENIQNRFVYAAGTNNPVGSTGGEAAHTLTTGEIPPHSHAVDIYTKYSESLSPTPAVNAGFLDYTYNCKGSAYSTVSYGGGGAHNNMPPYISAYCWRRTA